MLSKPLRCMDGNHSASTRIGCARSSSSIARPDTELVPSFNLNQHMATSHLVWAAKPASGTYVANVSQSLHSCRPVNLRGIARGKG